MVKTANFDSVPTQVVKHIFYPHPSGKEDKYKYTVKPRILLILGPSKIVPQIAKSTDCECYCM